MDKKILGIRSTYPVTPSLISLPRKFSTVVGEMLLISFVSSSHGCCEQRPCWIGGGHPSRAAPGQILQTSAWAEPVGRQCSLHESVSGAAHVRWRRWGDEGLGSSSYPPQWSRRALQHLGVDLQQRPEEPTTIGEEEETRSRPVHFHDFLCYSQYIWMCLGG